MPFTDFLAQRSVAMAQSLRNAVCAYIRTASQARRSSTSSIAVGEHTLKWMQNLNKKSPMEYIDEVPPIVCEERKVACIGSDNPALGHPVEYICLDSDGPNVCKYCGLRYVQAHHGGH